MRKVTLDTLLAHVVQEEIDEAALRRVLQDGRIFGRATAPIGTLLVVVSNPGPASSFFRGCPWKTPDTWGDVFKA